METKRENEKENEIERVRDIGERRERKRGEGRKT